MARAQVLGNGHLAVCLDRDGALRDLYFPYIGLENHVLGGKHRVGLWWDGIFAWLDSRNFNIEIGYENRSMLSKCVYQHKFSPLRVEIKSVVYNEIPVFVRSVLIYDPEKKINEARVFFGQEFSIGENKFRDTGFYDPTKNVVMHYKGRRVFLVNGQTERNGIDDYTVGMFNFAGREGSFRDAENGVLSKNAVEHGPVDSVVGFKLLMKNSGFGEVHYWICAGHSLDEVYKLNNIILTKTPHGVIHSTTSFWQAWADTRKLDFKDLSPEIVKVYYDSLFTLRAHLDHKGGIIASLDSEMLVNGKDSYAYVWPRDAAFVAMALDKAGYSSVTNRFYDFCLHTQHEDGYLHHKFLPDYSLGSTWQSSIIQKDWLKNKILQLPIQEDETATIIWGLWEHYQHSNDIEFIEEIYKPFIEKAAEFMVEFRDKYTGLPIQSYDLWEEVSGVSTYTCAAVYGGLMAASKFATVLGKYNHAHTYSETAESIRDAMKKYLFDKNLNSFVRGLQVDGVSVKKMEIIDSSSLFGLWFYDVLPNDDEMMVGTVEATDKYLHLKKGIGGFIRYQNDNYYRDEKAGESNPWIVTTLWDLGRKIKYETDLDKLRILGQNLNWVIDRLKSFPVMAEQYHPYTGEALSATPLAWSCAVFVETVIAYIEKYQMLEKENAE